MGKVQARPVNEEERRELQAGLKVRDGIVVRRSQAILISADEGLTPQAIADRLGCSREIIRPLIHAFNEVGIACLYPQSTARKDDQRAFNDEARDRLREMILCSPREFGRDTSLWTLDVLADVSEEQGLTNHRVHKDTVSETLMQMGLPWKRAKKTIHSPDPNYESKKNAAIGSNAWSNSTLNGY
jgi:transposase